MFTTDIAQDLAAMGELEELKCALRAVAEAASCHFCLQRLPPSVIVCLRGHAICVTCRPSVLDCPTCGQSFSPERQVTLSQILGVLPFPCKFPDCPEVSSGIQQHEKRCGHRPSACRICEWSGKAKDLLGHCSRSHRVLMDNPLPISLNLYKSSTSLCMYQVFDQFFWVLCKYNCEHNLISVEVTWEPDGKLEESVLQLRALFESNFTQFERKVPLVYEPKKLDSKRNQLMFTIESLNGFINPHTQDLDFLLFISK